MLRRFNVKNFMSFSCSENGKSEEFSMIPGKVRNFKNHIYDDGNNKLLKFAAIYGANAAGKSNIVKAISCMRNILLTNSTVGYIDKYSKIGEGNENSPSYFEAELVLDRRRYSYGFEVVLSQSQFISEWLIELISDNEEKVIFERDLLKSSDIFYQEWLANSDLKTRLEIYIEEASSDKPILFLHTINQQKQKFYESFPQVSILKKIYDWFENSLNINEPEKPVYGYSFITTMEKIDYSLKLINSYGTGISGVKKVKITNDEFLSKLSRNIAQEYKREREKLFLQHERNLKLLKEYKSLQDKGDSLNYNKWGIIIDEIGRDLKKCIAIRTKDSFFILSVIEDNKTVLQIYELKLKHADNNFFAFGEESDGTKRLWDVLEVLLAEINSTFIIDEIDRCLHPVLTYRFVKDFFESTGKKNVQLIVTTHESRLLDFELLRRDEIWFVDKRKSGESDIYSLEEYNERFDKKIDKAYLEGRYGGVPIFTTLFPIEDKKI